MILPLAFIGISTILGSTGVGATIKAGIDHKKTKEINMNSEERITYASHELDTLRKQCGEALENFGKLKMFVMDHTIQLFLQTFSKIKNVNFSSSENLFENKKLHIDKKTFEEITALKHFAVSLVEGSIAGITGGAVAAFGAYGLASTFATASTGTAIGTLSGAAATNATLAFFGGGSLATGGLGMAGGTAVLGGLVAGPALLVMGIITGAKAGKNLENAKANAAEVDVICKQLENGVAECIAIRRRISLFYNLLVRLDSYFLPLVYKLQDIVKNEGEDYSTYSNESQEAVAMAVSSALSVKAVLDTAILTDDGKLADISETNARKIKEEFS